MQSVFLSVVTNDKGGIHQKAPMHTDELLGQELCLKISNRVGVSPFSSVFEMENGIIILPLNHDDIFDGNTGLLLEIDHYKMGGGNNSIFFM